MPRQNTQKKIVSLPLNALADYSDGINPRLWIQAADRVRKPCWQTAAVQRDEHG
jgi:hypothetical protein